MRYAGRLTDWHDDKGYGFVVPHDGGEWNLLPPPWLKKMPKPVNLRPLRTWKRAMFGVVVLVAGGNGYFLFRGYTPGPIAAGNYMMCLLMGAAAPITVAMAAKGFVDGERDIEPAVGFVAAWLCPLAAVLSWLPMLAGFVAFIDGWAPPVRWLFANPLAFWACSIALGLFLIVALLFFLARLAVGLSKWRRRGQARPTID